MSASGTPIPARYCSGCGDGLCTGCVLGRLEDFAYGASPRAERSDVLALVVEYRRVASHVNSLTPCACERLCGDDGNTDGPGVCKGLPLPKREPLVEIVLVHRDGPSLD